MEAVSREEARRMALAAQGFGTRPEGPVGVEGIQRVFEHVNLVQIDSVNVLERSHYLPFFSRLGPYDKRLLDRYCYEERHVFEQWGHMASFIPIGQYGLMRHRMERTRPWTGRKEYLHAILEEVRERGPLTVGQLEDSGKSRGNWWGWSDGKRALEWHFWHGNVAAAGRKNFARLYDLAERVFPPEVLGAPPIPKEEAQRQMLLVGARAHGIGTARDLADYFRLKMPEARPRLRELVDSGELEAVEVEGSDEVAYVLRGARLPAEVDARALLSPFDSLVWERDRTERLFDFRYRIEIYTPEPKRVYGYYVLPFLLGDQLVGRVDLKANRQSGALEARAAYLEPGVERKEAAAALAAELKLMAEWLGLERVEVGERGDLARDLKRETGRRQREPRAR